MTLKLYLLRHGQTTFSREDVFCGSIDPPLTAAGEQMAQTFSASYQHLPWQAVYTSPMQRTQATAQPLCTALSLKPEVRDGLREIAYGQWEGQSKDAVDQTYHDDYLRWLADPAWYPPTGGELAVTVASRVLSVLEEIKQKHPQGNVLVVSHKATLRILLCSLLGIDVGRFRYRLGMPVGAISLVEFGTHGPLLLALADRTHLGDLRDLPGT
ncbi:histidine phosphatase family protein [Candidatus Cyanaurora vandensis]|uniref:histidine phosphatase family protein n=1 Tax=Candidatus Cyanaurora vandensis TaxID=2714958 RepID=UPI00257F4917|nr:histidine phosphatase family protein [Candidatus Cyanaurora vandensis]